MRTDLYWTLSVLSSAMWLLILVIMVFYAVFAFYRDRITNPRLAYWAYYCLSIGLLMPSLSALLPLFGDPGSLAALLTVTLSPLGLFVGMVLLIWSLLPSAREHLNIQFAETTTPTPSVTSTATVASQASPSTETPS